MLDVGRIQKELAECARNKGVSGVNIELNGASLSHLSGTISGPVGTPYEGGLFRIDIQLPGTLSFLFLFSHKLIGFRVSI